MKVAWDISHQEFTIEDDYYFSKLKKYAKKEGIQIFEIKKFSELQKFEILVFNYPEKPFLKKEIQMIKKWQKEGKKMIFTGYYLNEDGVAEIINNVLSGIASVKINYDKLISKKYFFEDPLFVLTRCGKLKVLMPCSASLKGGKPFLKTFSGKIAGTKEKNIYLLGTCVFWDNFSIDKFDNKKFSLKLLKGEI